MDVSNTCRCGFQCHDEWELVSCRTEVQLQNGCGAAAQASLRGIPISRRVENQIHVGLVCSYKMDVEHERERVHVEMKPGIGTWP